MSNKNNIYSFFIIVALLFWNPLFYFFFYDRHAIPVQYSHVIHIIFWLTFIVCLFLALLVRKKDICPRVCNIIFSFSFLGICFGILVLLNAFLGFAGSTEEPQEGLVFPPNSIAHYSTVEFDYEAKTNSIGLRDNEIKINKNNKYRILAFGDSWTFGWGVNLADSWPKQLEQYLHRLGHSNIEVINCGRGGQFTTTYKKYMAKAVPKLKPDMILVGVLQGDDLAQLYEHNFLEKETDSTSIGQLTGKITAKRFKNLFKYFLRASLGNITSLLYQDTTIEIQRDWESSANNRIKSFNHSQLLNYKILDEEVRDLFETGNLNPGLLYSYVDNPLKDVTINQPDIKATQFAVKEMDNDFKEMKKIAENNDAQLIFINLPTAGYTGHNVVRTPNHWILNDFLYNNNMVDSFYKTIALKYEIPYIQLTEHFKSLTDKDKYFFKYDGHPNEHGYNEIAEYIGNELLNFKLLNN